MPAPTDVDRPAAHRLFAAECFNETWALLDKPSRTPEEDEQMIRLALASHWHWTQRPDYAPEKASVAHWQTSRVYAVLGQAENARRYAQLCIVASKDGAVEPFYRGFAYEALARAELAAGDRDKARQYVAAAKEYAEEIESAEDKKALLDDLASIR